MIVKEIIERGNVLLLITTTTFFINHKIEIESFKELEISSNLDKTTISLGYSYIERDAKRVTRQTIDIKTDNANREIFLEDAFCTKSTNKIRSYRKGVVSSHYIKIATLLLMVVEHSDAL